MSLVFDHVGVVTSSMEETLKMFKETLGLKQWTKGILEDRPAARMTMLYVGDRYLEILEPRLPKDGSENRFTKFMKEKGEGIFHISIFTDEFEKDLAHIKNKGYTVEETRLRNMFPGYEAKIAWLQPKETHGIWIELCESQGHPKEYLNHEL